MTDNHPITPPPELVAQWSAEIYSQTTDDDERDLHIATQAARWGADHWQPITTAPRDGTEILASDLDCIDIVSWDEWQEREGSELMMTDWREKAGWTNRDGDELWPCHWQPLPDHPVLPLPSGEVG